MWHQLYEISFWKAAILRTYTERVPKMADMKTISTDPSPTAHSLQSLACCGVKIHGANVYAFSNSWVELLVPSVNVLDEGPFKSDKFMWMKLV